MTRRLTRTSIRTGPVVLAVPAILSALGCGAQRPWGRAHVVEMGASEAAPRTIEIVASRNAFTPSQITVRVGERVRLRFERIVKGGCAKEVIVSLDDRHEIRKPLPFNVPVEIAIELDGPGELGFTCGMHMLGGTIDVQR